MPERYNNPVRTRRPSLGMQLPRWGRDALVALHRRHTSAHESSAAEGVAAPTNAAEAWRVGIERNGPAVNLTYPRLINRGIEWQWSTNPATARTWQFLNTAANHPFIAATSGVTRVPLAITNAPAAYFRARVFEP